MGNTTNVRDFLDVIKYQINQLKLDKRLINNCIHPTFKDKKEKQVEIDRIDIIINLQEEIYFSLLKIIYNEQH